MRPGPRAMSPFRDNGREPPRCGCGHHREHPFVSPEPHYTALGWFFILLGVSWEPVFIAFVCRRCSDEVERIDDPRAMASVRLYG